MDANVGNTNKQIDQTGNTDDALTELNLLLQLHIVFFMAMCVLIPCFMCCYGCYIINMDQKLY